MKYDKIDKAIDEIRHYFNMNLNDYDKKRLRGIMTDLLPKRAKREDKQMVKVEQVFVYTRGISEYLEDSVLKDIALRICKEMGVEYKDLISGSRSIRKGILPCKVAIIKEIYSKYRANPAQVGEVLGMDRTTVMYHRDGRYVDVKKRELRKRLKNGQNT